MKKLMMTAAAIAVSATSAFSIGLGDVDHLVDNQFSDQTWANVFFVAYADEQGGKVFYDQESVLNYLENEIETAELTRELNYEELPLWESGSDEYFEVIKRIHGLNGKILGAGKLITAIDDLDDTSAIDAATATIDHLTKQSAYLADQVVSLNGQLSTIAAETAAEVSAEFEADISVLNDEIAEGNANADLLVIEIETAQAMAQTHYDSLKVAEAAATDFAKALDNSQARVEILQGKVDAAKESHSSAVDAIADYNDRDAAKYEKDPTAHLHAIYGYVLHLRGQLGLN